MNQRPSPLLPKPNVEEPNPDDAADKNPPVDAEGVGLFSSASCRDSRKDMTLTR